MQTPFSSSSTGKASGPACRRWFRLGAILCAVQHCALAGAADHLIVCPHEVPRKAIEITAPPEGWTAFVPFEFAPGLPLVSAGVMWGPPSTMTISKPTFAGKLNGLEVEKWEQLSEMDGVEKWIACFYGQDGRKEVILSQRIPDAARECVVKYHNGNSSTEAEIHCSW